MKLLEPIKVGNIEFKNRIMFPPLTTGYEEKDGSIGEQSFRFYERLAKGGVGYIVIGDVAPLPTFSPTPKLYSSEQVQSFKRLADACHENGAKLGIQLFHPDYNVKALNDLFHQGKMQEARAKLHHDMQHFVNEVTAEELDEIIKHMENCAILAHEAGVDCIEVHGDRLVGSLCSPILNHRTDEYGGDLANRTRFALTLVKRLKTIVPDMVIDYKLPIVTPLGENSFRGKGGLPLDEACIFAKELEACGVDTLHVAQANHTGNMGDTIPAMGTQPYGFMVSYSKKIKELVSIPVSVVGRIVTPEAAEAVITNGSADIIGLGRSLLTDPDFANKCADGHCCNVRTCMMCNKGCTDNIQNRAFLSCVLNAENGYEGSRQITPAASTKNIAIIGAGIAGLEAARVSALRGHHVTIFEKSLQIGGQLLIASVPPRKEEMMRSINYYTNVLPELDVTFRLGQEFTSQDYNSFDEVIVATGANNAIIPVPGKDLPTVASAWDVLAKKEIVFGNVSVIGGGLVGVETAEYLASRGCKVTIIEMMVFARIFTRIYVHNGQGFRGLNYQIAAGFEPYTLFSGFFKGLGQAIDAVQGRCCLFIEIKLWQIRRLTVCQIGFQFPVNVRTIRHDFIKAVGTQSPQSCRVSGRLFVYKRKTGAVSPGLHGVTIGFCQFAKLRAQLILRGFRCVGTDDDAEIFPKKRLCDSAKPLFILRRKLGRQTQMMLAAGQNQIFSGKIQVRSDCGGFGLDGLPAHLHQKLISGHQCVHFLRCRENGRIIVI